MKQISGFFLALTLFLIYAAPVKAVTDPLSVPNNRFGIHIFDEKDLDNAAKLVNSNGGSWGYVTFVITEGERDRERWQQVFDKMRRLHLIPIVRLATKANGGVWEKPKDEEINNWLAFLNSLNWVTQNRYVIIGNEPNLDNEWGGKSDPVEYAHYLKDFSAKLKQISNDFFVLPAPLAPNLSESKFIRSMLKAEPDVFGRIDGWASHSYPKETLAASSTELYKDELKTAGLNIPVFITETGWSSKKFSEDVIGQKLTSSFSNEWKDAQVVAVTPFILNYPQEPFAEFSWQRSDGSFYNYYLAVQKMDKVKGEPVQLESGQILAAFAQPVVLSGSDYLGAILAKNTGQSIWNTSNTVLKADQEMPLIQTYSFNEIEPMKLGLIIFKSSAQLNTGIYSKSLFLSGSNGRRITNSFPIEAVILKLDQVQIQAFFAKIGAYLKAVLRI